MTRYAEIEKALRWIASQENLFFTECTQAEEIIARARAALALPEDSNETITLDGSQIAQLLDLADNDFEVILSIKWFPKREPTKDGDELPSGYYAWFTEYPEEGALLLELHSERVKQL